MASKITPASPAANQAPIINMPKLFPATAPGAAAPPSPRTPIPLAIADPAECTNFAYDPALNGTHVNFWDGKRHRHYTYGGRLGFICGVSVPALVVLEHLVCNWQETRPNLAAKELAEWEVAIMDVVLATQDDLRISLEFREYFRSLLAWTHCTSCLWAYLTQHASGGTVANAGAANAGAANAGAAGGEGGEVRPLPCEQRE